MNRNFAYFPIIFINSAIDMFCEGNVFFLRYWKQIYMSFVRGDYFFDNKM